MPGMIRKPIPERFFLSTTKRLPRPEVAELRRIVKRNLTTVSQDKSLLLTAESAQWALEQSMRDKRAALTIAEQLSNLTHNGVFSYLKLKEGKMAKISMMDLIQRIDQFLK